MKIKYNILLLFPIVTFSQLSEKVNTIYKGLLQKDRIESQNLGYSGEESSVYKMYEELDSIANDEEILFMVQNGNDVVKGYLSLVMVDRKSEKLIQLFSNYINDDKKIKFQNGCVGDISTTAGQLYGYLFYQKEKIDLIKNYENESDELKVTLKEYYGNNFAKQYKTKWTKKEVDSVLNQFNEIVITNDSIIPETIDIIFELNNYKFKNYERVKYFAHKYMTRETIATLANFQNKKDLPFFLQNIDNSFLAISKFPDESFIKILQNKENENLENLDYYEAISSICNEDVDQIKRNIFDKLSRSVNIFTQEYIQYLDEALKKYSCEYNSNLQLEIEKFHNR
ncbi:hypothetical protein [Flavobacterium sp.]|uniref:hypothetical protein n=1 Tax=Flavobacterium sp. TaxID=239 RepID=UPI002616505A|nr:hypothetical protein [Flavobacterium sp.]